MPFCQRAELAWPRFYCMVPLSTARIRFADPEQQRVKRKARLKKALDGYPGQRVNKPVDD